MALVGYIGSTSWSWLDDWPLDGRGEFGRKSVDLGVVRLPVQVID